MSRAALLPVGFSIAFRCPASLHAHSLHLAVLEVDEDLTFVNRRHCQALQVLGTSKVVKEERSRTGEKDGGDDQPLKRGKIK